MVTAPIFVGGAGTTGPRTEARRVGERQDTDDLIGGGRVTVDEQALYLLDHHLLQGRV